MLWNKQNLEKNALEITSDSPRPVLAVFLCAQVPEGQCCHAHRDYEHLRATEGEPAGPLLLRPHRAAGDRPPEPAVRPQCRLPLAALALVHDNRRGPHHPDGEAHTVPLQAVWRDREDKKVKSTLGSCESRWWTRDMRGIVWTKPPCCDLLRNVPLELGHLEQLSFTAHWGCDCL